MAALGSDSTESFLDYAQTQHDLAVELSQRHAPEATGCCRTCGRVFPCDGYEHGQHMRAHYESYLRAAPEPPAGSQERHGRRGDERLTRA